MTEEIKSVETVAAIENADTDPAPAPEPDIDDEGPQLNNPLMAFVKDGTTTWASDQEVERRFQDSEHRRDQADIERKIGSTPIDQGGGVLNTHKLTDNPEIPKAYIHLQYLNRHGAHTGIACMADLIVGIGENPLELMLIIVCPNCVQNRRLHLDQAQIQIRQSNRKFEFLGGKGDPTFLFDGMVYNSAGMIMESEKFTCPNCQWSARIDKNMVIPE